MTGLDAFFESYYRLRPVNATFTGVHEFDDRLPDWSPDGLAAAVDEMRALRESLANAGGPLDEVGARDRALAAAFLDIQIAEHECGHFQRGNPSLAAGEAIFGVIALMTRAVAPIAHRAEAAIARLDAVPAFLNGAQRSIAAGVPDEWRSRCLRECEGAGRLFDDGIPRWIALESIDESRADRLLRAAGRAGEAFDDFRRWAEGDGNGPTKVGRHERVGRHQRHGRHERREQYACGPELFDLLLARGHWCDRSRADLAAEATQALDEALARLDERARQLAPGGWPEG